MSTINLLYQSRYPINDNISVEIPAVGQILDCEDDYYSVVNAFTAMPIDMIVPLDDANIDFTTLTEWDLFILMFKGVQEQDTSLVLGNLDLSKFVMDVSPQNGSIILKDRKTGVVIDRAIHGKIATVLRTIHHLEKNRRRPANEEAKAYMIQRAHEKAKRQKNRKTVSQLESLIVAMVNCEQFKYDFEGVRNMTIYQFRECVRQVIRKNDYNNLMHGVYAGTVNVKELSQDAMNWLTPKS